MQKLISSVVVAFLLVTVMFAQGAQKRVHTGEDVVFINGEVAKPGPYPFAERMTALDLITLAGGLKPTAAATIRIVKGNSKDAQGRPDVAYLNVTDIKTPEGAKRLTFLEVADTVVVEARK